MIVVDPGSTRRYVLKAERGLPEEKQSVFLLRPLTLRESSHLEDMAVGIGGSGNSEVTINSGSVRIQALRYGLAGWENVVDGNGNAVEFRSTTKKVKGVEVVQPDDSTIAMIPPACRLELAEEITNGGSLTQEEAGNS